MSQQEVEVLQKESSPIITIFGIIVFILLGFWGYTLEGSWVIWWTDLIITVILYLFLTNNRKFRQDLNDGQKVILQTKLEKKREDSGGYNSYYYCTLAGKEFEITFEQWEKLKVDQLTEIHFAPYSKHIFLLTQE